MTVNDRVMKALYDLGYRGSYNDRVLSHMKDELGVTNINEGYYKAGGFGKYVEGLLSPVINYVARLDGVSQYWQLSEGITLELGDLVEFEFVSVGDNTNSFVIDSTDRSSFIFNKDSTVQRSSALGFMDINGERVQNLATPFPSEGVVNIVSIRMDVSVATIDFIGCEYREDRGYFSGLFRNFKVIRGGGVIHQIPLTNKAQGATQLATVGNVNATMPNYTPDVWEVNNADS